jgi:hypothetical protein
LCKYVTVPELKRAVFSFSGRKDFLIFKRVRIKLYPAPCFKKGNQLVKHHAPVLNGHDPFFSMFWIAR